METEIIYKKFTESSLTEKFPNDSDTDFKPEVVASSLIEQGYDPEQIVIVRQGYAKRGFSPEIEDIELKYSLQELQDFLYIKINRESLYDILPQGLFHQPVYRKKINKNKEEILEEIAIHRREEFFARKFFQAFEIVSEETLTNAFLYETCFNKKISHPEFINLFLPYWPILKLLAHKRCFI